MENNNDILYNVRAFLGDDLSAVFAKIALDKSYNKEELTWVSLDTTLEIVSGGKVVDLRLDFWEEEQKGEMLGKLSTLIEVLQGMEKALESAIPVYEELRKEAKLNREEDVVPII